MLGAAGVIVKMGGLDVYMTQYFGRGAISLISTRVVWAGGRVSKLRTASFAAASARSFPRMLVCPRILCRVFRKPSDALAFSSSVMLCKRSMWWW